MAQFKCSIMGPMPCALLPQWLRYQKAWTDLILCKILLLHQMLFQYRRNYNNWFWLPVKSVDVKLHEMRACICYLSENFTKCDEWRCFKAVRQRMTSCTRLQGHVCIIILLFLLQRSVSLKAFRKRKTFQISSWRTSFDSHMHVHLKLGICCHHLF